LVVVVSANLGRWLAAVFSYGIGTAQELCSQFARAVKRCETLLADQDHQWSFCYRNLL